MPMDPRWGMSRPGRRPTCSLVPKIPSTFLAWATPPRHEKAGGACETSDPKVYRWCLRDIRSQGVPMVPAAHPTPGCADDACETSAKRPSNWQRQPRHPGTPCRGGAGCLGGRGPNKSKTREIPNDHRANKPSQFQIWLQKHQPKLGQHTFEPKPNYGLKLFVSAHCGD